MAKNKHLPKLVTAAAMVALSASMLSTASFAWFSMNTTVEASGMEMTATTPINLLMSDAVNSFESNITANEVFSPNAALYPASSLKGITFNAIDASNYLGINGAGGVAKNETTFLQTSKVTADALTNGQGSAPAPADTMGYFATFTYKMKLSQAQTSATNVYLSNLTVADKGIKVSLPVGTQVAAGGLVGGVAHYTDVACNTPVASGTLESVTTAYKKANLNRAVRVAVYQGDVEDANFKGVYAIKDATDNYYAVVDTVDADGDVISGLEAKGANMSNGTNYFIAAAADGNFAANVNINYITLAANSTDAVDINLVVWIEGQDAACVNVNAGATFAISVAFAIAV